jgi:hypothetical protein
VHGGDDPGKFAQLGVSAERAKEERTFPRILAVILAVDDVVPAVDEEAEGKGDKEHAEPEVEGGPDGLLSDREKIKPDSSEPKARAGGLEDEF